MTIWKNYFLAETVQEALELLAQSEGDACPIAGGTDLLLDLQQGRHPPLDTLVDLSQIPEMRQLEIRGGKLFIGAALPLNRLVESPLAQQHAPTLMDAARLIGGPQVRNTATLGGNVCHALPAADGTIALLSLNATALVARLEQRCEIPLGELFRGPGKSALDPRREILVGFNLPLREAGQASAFRRVMRPQGVAIAILNLAVWLQRAATRIADIRIAIGPAGPTPLRAVQTEAALRSQPYQPTLPPQALEALLSESRFRTSPHRATEAYRRAMAGVLLQETLEVAWQRTLDVENQDD
ncbi:MAG: hypothetical protein B6D39_11935 [Anaerolineae bacterium UTCFX2]|jgi:carbon-monoxide dehydrogenase medium subunit|nr:MAG: hypothetical protein B6D39_11935 [Anaerolineae bacterium UTCFX2]